jgi:serine/threonine protein kinase
MGVVFKAYDVVTKRHVALKTMRGTLSPAALHLFTKEWSVLAQLSHPNIVDVLDTGEFEQDGQSRPFFVMPFLPGSTLDQLMQNSSSRLTLERTVGIIAQTCRGLQAAHERGLIHRDLKPSNIFVMDDDAVKIIDFGIVHLAGAESIAGLKGTLQYMAPEQIDMKPATAASDIFALGVVCYEALTGRKPFERRSEMETANAIRRQIPPPICDLNPLVSQLVSRVVHKAMAKDPYHRFSTAREFAESLQKALNGEVLERFDRAKLQPRIERAKKAQAEGDHQFASEILGELEAEGNIDPEMSVLRIQLDNAVRQKSIRQLLDSARTRLEEGEFPLAQQKIREVLEIDPENADAIILRRSIEKQRSQQQAENWLRLVEQHLHNRAFTQARQGLEEILKLNPNDTRARELLVDVERREQEAGRLRGEKEELYQSAINCYNRGEISSALTRLERILEMGQRSPDAAIPDRDAQYQSLYNQVRSEREAARSAYAEGRRALADRNLARALEICNDFLNKNPEDPMFQALKLEVEEQRRQEQSGFIAEVSRRVDAEPDLDRRVNILKEAVERYPNEAHLQQSLRLVRERRDLVNSIVSKARQYEERGQFNEALSQFDILRNIYAQYPGIDFETERLRRRRDDQVRDESKGRWIEQIDRNIAQGDYARARDLVRTALSEFPDDGELIGLEQMVDSALRRSSEAEEWMQRGQKLCFDREFGEGLEALRKAASLDGRNPVIRAALLNALVEHARSVLGQDWRSAEPLVEQALNIDAGHPVAKSLQGLVLDYKRQEMVNVCVSHARARQASGDLNGALATVETVLIDYPNEVRLVQLRTTLRNMGAASTESPEATPEMQPEGRPAVDREMTTTLIITSTEPLHELPVATVLMEGPVVEGQVIREESAAPEPTAPDLPPSPPELPDSPPELPSSPPAWASDAQKEALAAAAAKPVAPAPPPHSGDALDELWIRIKESLQGLTEPRGKLRASKLELGMLALVPVILLAAVLVTASHKTKKAIPAAAAPAQFLVDVETEPAGAKYRVDGNPPSFPLRLARGEHKIEAFAPGYKTSLKSFTLADGVPRPFVVALQLEPELARLRLSSDLKSGTVTIDGQPAVDLQDGGFANDGVSLSTDHTVTVGQSGKPVLEFSFQVEPGGVVTLSSPLKAKDMDAVLVANLGSRARVYTSDSSLKGGIKDHPAQPIPAVGLDLTDLNGNTEFVLDNGKSPRQIPIEVGDAPSLAIWLTSNPNQGTLEIEANVPSADLYIDGRKRRPLRAGKNYIGLEPGSHTIKVAGDGYEAAPELKVELPKGETLRLPAFTLKPAVRTASLVIEGATRDAEVWIDGRQAGSIGGDGSFQRDDVAPNGHTITLKKADYEDKELSKTFNIGQAVHINGSEAQLTPFGSLEFRVSPQSATVSYKRADEAQMHTAENGKAAHVRAGRYAISAGAPGLRPRTETVSVEPGKPFPIDWTLASVEDVKKAAPQQTKQTLTKDYFLNAASWAQEGERFSHEGGGVSWLRNNLGVYTIELFRKTSKIGPIKRTKAVEWVIDQKDENNRIEYAFEFGSLERRVTVDGKALPRVKVATGAGESYTLQIDIRPDRITIRDTQGKELDQYQRPNPSEAMGRFGFKGDVELVIRKAEER